MGDESGERYFLCVPHPFIHLPNLTTCPALRLALGAWPRRQRNKHCPQELARHWPSRGAVPSPPASCFSTVCLSYYPVCPFLLCQPHLQPHSEFYMES